MNWRAIGAIVRKDLKAVVQNKGVVIPIVIVPVILFGLIPWIAALTPSAVNVGGQSLDEMLALIEGMPPGLRAELAPYAPAQQVVVFFLVYLLAPMFLIIPLMAASVIAADSIAGERERRTLEALLYSPTTDMELFAAKLAAPWLAALAVALGGFALYSVMANAAAWPVIGGLFFPNAMWCVLVLWVVPAAAGFGLGVMVLVSARAQGFQDAYQLGGAVVIPVLLLLFGQIAGVIYFSTGVAFLVGLVLWLLDGVLIWVGRRTFLRERLAARL